MWRLPSILLCAVALRLWGSVAIASDVDEFKVKREAVFEFAQKPQITRQGDRVTVSFESKGFCDVTVAVEDADGKIVRYLASGVLGPNAPEPFQKNTKRQTIIWDGKNDKGEYIDDKDSLTVRVSLGLQARYERSFLWSPYRRVGSNTPSICPAPEGVYVFEGNGFDHLRLFDHEGKYVRTVYPFPADKVDAVQGLKRHVMPQSGKNLALKVGMRQSTLLTSGYTCSEKKVVPDSGTATLAMAVWKDCIFMPCLRLNRLGTDGTSGGMPLEGPKTHFTGRRRLNGAGIPFVDILPRSAAVSADGKTLYYTGLSWGSRWDYSGKQWMHGVARMATVGDAPPRPFVGPALKEGEEFAGSDNAHFRAPTSVACDTKGRVYIADHANDRIQVFTPDGTHVKTIPVRRPSEVCVHHKTGDIYVFSWLFYGPFARGPNGDVPVPAVMHHFGPVEAPRKISSCSLPLRAYKDRFGYGTAPHGLQYRAALDSWTDPPTIWLVPTTYMNWAYPPPWKESGLLLLTEKDGKLELKRDFGRGAAVALARSDPPNPRQRLYVNPRTGSLHVGEGEATSNGIGFKCLTEIDPATGRQRLVQIPFDSEDLAFDMDGLAYLRTLTEIARYDPATWKEVPFDYGVERQAVTTGSHSGSRSATVASVLVGPKPERGWHQGGLAVSPKGHVVAAVYCSTTRQDRRTDQAPVTGGRPYAPVMFPGRLGTAVINVWDRHGRLVKADAIPGLGVFDGLAMDKNDDLYVMSAATRVLDGKRYFDYMTGTAIKFRFGKAKVITTSGGARLPLTGGSIPKRPPELADGSVGTAWAEGAHWLYGGVSYTGNDHLDMGGCSCWNARFALDYFARSFLPEIEHYSVAVLDTNGNLIMRVGRYGNVDDGKPLVAKGGPPNPRSIGGDEVGLFYPAYLATHTDRRLFIADPGNARIVSVKLGYHATERVALKDVTHDGS